MRGEIFNELLEFAAERIGSEAAATLTTPDGRRAAGAYDASVSYELADLVHLVDQLASASGEPRGRILAGFGRHLFDYFAALYPAFFDQAGSALALLEGIDSSVHAELKKLYPDADFPRFACRPLPPRGLEMTYRSERPLADLAEGLIEGCIGYFGEPLRVAREDLPGRPGTAARFTLTPER